MPKGRLARRTCSRSRLRLGPSRGPRRARWRTDDQRIRQSTGARPTWALALGLLSTVAIAACSSCETTGTPETYLAGFDQLGADRRLSRISKNASGITWMQTSESFLVIRNDNARIYEYPSSLLGRPREFKLPTEGGRDAEAIVAIGEREVAVAFEDGAVRVYELSNGWEPPRARLLESYRPLPPPTVGNRGLEGIAYRPGAGGRSGTFFVCQEGGRQGVPMRVVQFERAGPGASLTYRDAAFAVREPWSAQQLFGDLVTDLSGLTYDASAGALLLVSDEVPAILRVNPESGILLSFDRVPNFKDLEGIALGGHGEIVLVSEPNTLPALDPSPVIPSDLSFGYLSAELKSPVKIPILVRSQSAA